MIKQTAVVLAAAAATAVAQDVEIVASAGNETPAAGETVTITYTANITNAATGGAVGGFGFDSLVTDANGAVDTVGTATFGSVFNVGTIAGAVNGTNVEGIIGGQLPNVFGVNPSVVTSYSVALFTHEITVAATAADGDEIQVTGGNGNALGTLVFFPDSAAASSTRVPSEGGSVSFTGVTLTVGSGGGNDCPPDQNEDNVLDIDDFSVFVQNFFAGNTLADVNDDGSLDIDDFSDFVAFFFNSSQFPGCP